MLDTGLRVCAFRTVRKRFGRSYAGADLEQTVDIGKGAVRQLVSHRVSRFARSRTVSIKPSLPSQKRVSRLLKAAEFARK